MKFGKFEISESGLLILAFIVLVISIALMGIFG